MKKETKDKPAKSSNFDRMTNFIKNSSGKNLQSVVVPLELFEYAGETQKAVFLARLIYLSDKGSKPNGFIWKSYPEWKKEIGLSQSQVERIVKDFQGKRGILIAKKMMAASGNGNASHTWHYKLLMNKFLADFKKFLQVRSKENLQFELEETSASITESTNIKTTENTLLEEYNFSDEENQNEENLYVIEENEIPDSITSELGSDVLDDLSAPDSAIELRQISLPANFEPTLESKVWAMRNFPSKSIKQVTDKFRGFFLRNKHQVREEKQWQTEWRNWITSERVYGVNPEVLEVEHLEITNELLIVVWDFFNESEHVLGSKNRKFFVVPPGAIDDYFCVDREFDKKSIDESVDELLRQNYLAKYFGCYYNLELYKENTKWAQEVDKQMFSFSKLIEECDSIFAFVKENLAVNLKDVFEAFPKISEDSINNLFRVCLTNHKFRLVRDYYYEDVDPEEDSEKQDYLIAVNKKLAGLDLVELRKEENTADENVVESQEPSRRLISSGSGIEDQVKTDESELDAEQFTEKTISHQISRLQIPIKHAKGILDFSYQIKPYLMHRDSLYTAFVDFLSKRNYTYPREMFDEGLKCLCDEKIFQPYFEDYVINLFEFNKSEDWKVLTWKEIAEVHVESSQEIVNFITENVLVLDDVVENTFSDIDVKELELFINAKARYKLLGVEGHYIYNLEQYNSNPGYQVEVDKKKQELGLIHKQEG
jgi:hypothetical protein